MWSTVTEMPFLSPQSRANLSNHTSKAGTKWLHWMMVKVLVRARARLTNGAPKRGAVPAAARARPDRVIKPRRLIRGSKDRPPDDIVVLPIGILFTVALQKQFSRTKVAQCGVMAGPSGATVLAGFTADRQGSPTGSPAAGAGRARRDGSPRCRCRPR